MTIQLFFLFTLLVKPNPPCPSIPTQQTLNSGCFQNFFITEKIYNLGSRIFLLAEYNQQQLLGLFQTGRRGNMHYRRVTKFRPKFRVQCKSLIAPPDKGKGSFFFVSKTFFHFSFSIFKMGESIFTVTTPHTQGCKNHLPKFFFWKQIKCFCRSF